MSRAQPRRRIEGGVAVVVTAQRTAPSHSGRGHRGVCFDDTEVDVHWPLSPSRTRPAGLLQAATSAF
jgi:hypothetical protein